MFPVEVFERTIGKFVKIASAIGIPFHLTGGSISSAYGEPRLTQDIDAALSKLIWINKGSQRSRRDLRGVFRNCDGKQQDIIRTQALSMGLEALLDDVLSEPDEIR